jgi:hypothetical protein
MIVGEYFSAECSCEAASVSNSEWPEQPSVFGPLQHAARVTRFSRKLERRFEGYSGQRPLERRSGNPETASSLTHGQMAHGGNLLRGNLAFTAAKPSALRFRSR